MKSYAVVNPKNKYDSKCFLYSILAVLKFDVIEKNRQWISNYIPFLNELKYNEGDMPMRLSNIPKFERQNPQLRINIMQYTDHYDEEIITILTLCTHSTNYRPLFIDETLFIDDTLANQRIIEK